MRPGRQQFPEAFEQPANVPAGRGRHRDVVRQFAAHLLVQLEGGQLVALGADGPVAGHDAQVELLRQAQHRLLHQRIIRRANPDDGRAVDGHGHELLPRRELRHEDERLDARPGAVGRDGMAHVARRDGRRRPLAHLLRHENAGERAAVLEAPGGVLRFVLEQQALDAGKRLEPRARIHQRRVAFAQRGGGIHRLEREELREAFPEVAARSGPRPLDARDGDFQRLAVVGEFLQPLEGIFEARDGGNQFAHDRRRMCRCRRALTIEQSQHKSLPLWLGWCMREGNGSQFNKRETDHEQTTRSKDGRGDYRPERGDPAAGMRRGG